MNRESRTSQGTFGIQPTARRVHSLQRECFSILFPRRCILCDQLVNPEDRLIHAACKPLITPVGKSVCYRCGKPLISNRSEYCYDCSRKKDRLIKEGRALFLYEGEMRGCMYRFKYNNRRCYSEFFAEEAQEIWGKWMEQIAPEAIVPVPMYWKKEGRRGYNQAAVLGKVLSDSFGIPLERRLVRRVRDTRPMKELNDKERKNNLKNAFQVAKCIVKYKKILVVDDIYTTGATADAVAEVLHAAGVEEVYFFSICVGKGA